MIKVSIQERKTIEHFTMGFNPIFLSRLLKNDLSTDFLIASREESLRLVEDFVQKKGSMKLDVQAEDLSATLIDSFTAIIIGVVENLGPDVRGLESLPEDDRGPVVINSIGKALASMMFTHRAEGPEGPTRSTEEKKEN